MDVFNACFAIIVGFVYLTYCDCLIKIGYLFMSLVKKIFSLWSTNEQDNVARIAKDRLKIILAHERSALSNSNRPDNWLQCLQKELMDVVAKYANINNDDIKINIDKQDDLELLEISISLPDDKTK